jgi:hypothetical protein
MVQALSMDKSYHIAQCNHYSIVIVINYQNHTWGSICSFNDHEAFGSRRRRSPPPPPPRATLARPRQVRRSTTPRRAQRPPRDRGYMRVHMARRLYACGQPVPWPDVNLPAKWRLNSRRVSVPPVPRDGPERVQEIRRRRTCFLPRCAATPRFPSSPRRGTRSCAGSGTRKGAPAISAI